MPAHRHLDRYREIVGVLVDEGLASVLDATGLRRFAPVAGRIPRPGSEEDSLPVRVRRTFERLGPAFIKIGQVASTRSDLIPAEFITELSKLQDRVPPFPFEEARAVIEEELGAPIAELFAGFDETPLAAASLGQVHIARLNDGAQVAVKVQRPGVRRLVETDLEILRSQASAAATYGPLAEDFDVVAIVDEFADAVRQELDYISEARNADRLGRLFDNDDTVQFPRVYWDLTTERVLVLDYLDGVPFNRLDLLAEGGFDRPLLAERGINAFLEQIFIHGFYHADPHPGNLLALAGNRVAFTDFGRTGSVSAVARGQLADLLVAIVDDDVGWAVDTLLEAAGSHGDADVTELTREVSRLISKYYNRSLREVRVGDLISEVLGLVRVYHLMLSSELAMLLATLVVLEGLGARLDPEFDFVEVTTPFARRIVAERMEWGEITKSFSRSARRFGRLVWELPESLTRFMRRAGSGEFRVAVHPTGFEPLLKRFEDAANRLAFALVVAAFVVGLSLLLAQTELPLAFVWLARLGWASAVGIGTWFFVSSLIARYRRR